MTFRERLVRFYTEYNPEKLGEVDDLLKTFRGREESMFTALEEKYGVGRSSRRLPTVSVSTASDNGNRTATFSTSPNQLRATPPPSPPRVVVHANAMKRDAHPMKHNVQSEQPSSSSVAANININSYNNDTKGSVNEDDGSATDGDGGDDGQGGDAVDGSLLDLFSTLQRLFGEMTAVNMDKLLELLEGGGPAQNTRSSSTVDTAVLAHTLKFLQHFNKCAKEWLQTAREARETLDGVRADVVSQRHALQQEREDMKTANMYRSPRSEERYPSPSPQTPNRPVTGAVYASASQLESTSKRKVTYANRVSPASHRSNMVITRSRRVHTIPAPPSHAQQRAVITELLQSREFTSGDLVALEPGVYYDNILVTGSHCRVEITVAADGLRKFGDGVNNNQSVNSSIAARQVIIRPLFDRFPVFHVTNGAALMLRGVALEGGIVELPVAPHKSLVNSTAMIVAAAAAEPQAALLEVDDGGQAEVDGCLLRSGCGAATVSGNGSHCVLLSSVITGSDFCGVFAGGGADVVLGECKITQCECAIRASDAAISMLDCVVERSSADGVVCYGGVSGTFENCLIKESDGNGVLLSPETQLTMVGCTVERNGQFGVHCPLGAQLKISNSVVRNNGVAALYNDNGGSSSALEASSVSILNTTVLD